jgi:hypothetical protein
MRGLDGGGCGQFSHLYKPSIFLGRPWPFDRTRQGQRGIDPYTSKRNDRRRRRQSRRRRGRRLRTILARANKRLVPSRGAGRRCIQTSRILMLCLRLGMVCPLHTPRSQPHRSCAAGPVQLGGAIGRGRDERVRRLRHRGFSHRCLAEGRRRSAGRLSSQASDSGRESIETVRCTGKSLAGRSAKAPVCRAVRKRARGAWYVQELHPQQESQPSP